MLVFGHVAKLPSDGATPYALLVFAGMLSWTFLRQFDQSAVDARLLHSQESELVGPALRDDDDYAASVASAAYNLNVSGLSLSLPFRFIDSLMLGTAVVTDQLSIHWYLPFDEQEVIELPAMGYELDQDVDWAAIEEKLTELANSSQHGDAERAAHILDRYQKHWSPFALANYVIRACEEAI